MLVPYVKIKINLILTIPPTRKWGFIFTSLTVHQVFYAPCREYQHGG